LVFHELVDGSKLKQELGDRAHMLQIEAPCLMELSDEEDETQESDEELGF
jgi:hypothetical protein